MPREARSVSDIGQHIQLLLLERVRDGHITASCNLHYDDGERIWAMVDRLFEGLGPDGGKLVELGEQGPDRRRRLGLTERGKAKLRELSAGDALQGREHRQLP